MKWILALFVFIISFSLTLGAFSTRDIYLNTVKNNLNSTSTTNLEVSQRSSESEVLAVNTSVNSFYLTPETKSLSAGQTFEVEVRLNAVTNINGVDVNLSYPSNLLKVNSVNEGNFGIVASESFSNGLISLAYGNVTPLTGDILVAKISFEAISSGTANVSFSNSRAVSSTSNQNVLNSVNNATYIIGAVPTVVSTNTVLSFSPVSANVNNGSEFDVQVRLNADVSINAVETNISYPSNLVDVVSINKQGGALEIEAAKSVANGVINLAYGSSTPKSGNNLLITTIKFKAKSPGSVILKHNNAKVLSSVNNSNVLNSTSQATYNIVAIPTPTSVPASNPIPKDDIFPWIATDIGNPLAGGQVKVSEGNYNIIGSGADIWGTSDQFRFAYQAKTGDFTLTTHVTGITNTDPWAKSGIMIRESTASNSKYAYVYTTPNTNGVNFEIRRFTGGVSEKGGVSNNKELMDVWLRLTKSGDNYSAYYSTNGTTWTQIEGMNINMTTTLAGMAVTSHDTKSFSTGEFRNIAFSNVVAPTQPPTATPTIVPKNPINWSTSRIELNASDFYISIDGQKFYAGQSTNFVVQSDPGDEDYTTLEATWFENGMEMRLNMYFEVVNGEWRVYEIRTYGAKNEGNWLYYNGFTGGSLGSTFTQSLFDIATNNNQLNDSEGIIHFSNLSLKPTFVPRTITPTTGIPTSTIIPNSPTPGLTCDPNGDGIINILDFQWWKDEYFGIRSSKDSDCFNQDGKVDLLDFQSWKDIAITKVKQPF